MHTVWVTQQQDTQTDCALLSIWVNSYVSDITATYCCPAPPSLTQHIVCESKMEISRSRFQITFIYLLIECISVIAERSVRKMEPVFFLKEPGDKQIPRKRQKKKTHTQTTDNNDLIFPTSIVCEARAGYSLFLCATGLNCCPKTIKNTLLSHSFAPGNMLLHHRERTHCSLFWMNPTYTVLLPQILTRA